MEPIKFAETLNDQVIQLSNFIKENFPYNTEHELGAIPTAIQIITEQQRLLEMTNMSDTEEFNFLGKTIQTLTGMYNEWRKKKIQNANIFADRHMESLAHDITILNSLLTAQGIKLSKHLEQKYGFNFKVLTSDNPPSSPDAPQGYAEPIKNNRGISKS